MFGGPNPRHKDPSVTGRYTLGPEEKPKGRKKGSEGVGGGLSDRGTEEEGPLKNGETTRVPPSLYVGPTLGP